MNKKELRQQFLEKRQKLSLIRLQEQSLVISQNFFNFFKLTTTKNIHIFLPIQKQNEINTWFIIQDIFQNYPRITPIVSKSNFQTSQMENYLLNKKTKLLKNQWGIPEPVDAVPCPNELIDMILIPLLCFDEQGFRVGYGQGFYDRFLSQCREDSVKIGLSLFEPVDRIENIHDNDIRLDFCVMTQKIWIR